MGWWVAIVIIIGLAIASKWFHELLMQWADDFEHGMFN